MNDDSSVSVWLQRLKEGSRDEAVGRLWERYFEQMVALARNYLRGRPRPVADAEDVALDAFERFVRAAQRGAFPRLHNRDDLWRILLTLTQRKALDQIDRDTAARRGSGKVVHASALGNDSSAAHEIGVSNEPDPRDAAAMAEGLEDMLTLLDKPGLRRVAVLRMEGSSNEETAAALDCSLATVERKLKTIRAIFRDAGLGID